MSLIVAVIIGLSLSPQMEYEISRGIVLPSFILPSAIIGLPIISFLPAQDMLHRYHRAPLKTDHLCPVFNDDQDRPISAPLSSRS